MDARYLPTSAEPGWVRFVMNLNQLSCGWWDDAVSANALVPVVPEPWKGVCGIVFEVNEFAAAHPELTFEGFIEYDDDSGPRAHDCWRFTVRSHEGANRVFLTRQNADKSWPDPADYSVILPRNRWPEGW